MNKLLLPFLLILLLVASGCMHYSTGSGTKLKFDKIYVVPVRNDSLAPQAQALLTSNVRTALSNQSGLELSHFANDAAVLEIIIVGFEQTTSTSRENDTLRAKSMNVTMTVICSLRDGESGGFYFKDQKVQATVECYCENDYQEAKYQIMPQLTQKIAVEICEIVSNNW